MLQLANYFQPLNIETLFYFVLLFFFFDVLGTFVKAKLLKKGPQESSRIINWLIGFGIFIFIWFLISLFIPYQRNPVLISLVLLLVISLPSYIKNSEFKIFFRELWSLKLPLVIVAFFLPAVFVKASLPPNYADEMAYHFISPSTLDNLKQIIYRGGLFPNVPRLQDVFYAITFSLVRTYSVARLFHFTILVTGLLYAYKVIKHHFGKVSAFLLVFVFFSLPQAIVLTSTLGYVDVAAYSFLFIGIIASIDFLITKSPNSLVLMTLFWAMNLGTKYTGVSAFVSFTLVFIGFLVLERKKYLGVFSKRLFLKLGLVFLIFGGYWYVKNLVIYGNPIYPFILPCFEAYAKDCLTGGSFFGTWTTQVNTGNAYIILKSLLAKNLFLQAMVLITPFLAIFGKSKKILKITIFVYLAVLIELLILSKFSGFYVRYHQHMQHYLIIAVVIQYANQYHNKLQTYFVKFLFAILTLSALSTFIFTVRQTNSLRFLNWQEINYSIGNIDIYQWIDWKFPKMDNVIRWCENPPDGKKKDLARFDPDLIWYTYAGFMRSFLTNCSYRNPPLEGVPIEKVLEVGKEKELQFWIATDKKCVEDSEVKPTRPGQEDEHKMNLRRLNNVIICNAEEVIPNLYYFDYSKLDI